MSDFTLSLPAQPVEDGYELWLRYRPLEAASQKPLRDAMQVLAVAPGGNATGRETITAALDELGRGLQGLSGQAPRMASWPADAAVLLATADALPPGKASELALADLGPEGYVVRATELDGRRVTLVAAQTARGLLYGSFALLRALQSSVAPAQLNLRSQPRVGLRMLNHWDNLDRTVERGYAGQSIWDWWKLPEQLDARYVDYARACASLGINAASLNNVNAKAEMLTAPWIAKAAAVAGVLRPYGIRVFLSARFSAPIELGGLASADPLDAKVAAWWRGKVDEIYRAIPDFGGFVVKANSEGQPGPRDYGRTHAEGANLFAQALAPHGGVVFWRAFVYSDANPRDRHMQAVDDFAPINGCFDANVVVQVKNGAIDFQPREPFHPLFGALPATAMALEVMVTKEYMGFSTHMAYLGLQYQETLRSDTHRPTQGHTVARVTQTPRSAGGPTAMVGVSNVGVDRNWCGSHFDQANWYAFGRLAWDSTLDAAAIAAEWVQQTFTRDREAVREIVAMMLLSREAVVNYMTPLGLHHIMATGHHHGPGPWISDLARPEWNPTYYHRAGPAGVGFDRGPKGSQAVAQYAPPLAAVFSDPAQTPENLLLWFHHLPWTHAMRSGRTLWNEIVARYDQGVEEVADLQRRWQALAPQIDARRHADVAASLAQQAREAQWWRDACLAYFHEVSGQPWPEGARRPERSLAEYQAIRFLHAPGCGG